MKVKTAEEIKEKLEKIADFSDNLDIFYNKISNEEYIDFYKLIRGLGFKSLRQYFQDRKRRSKND